MNREGRDVIMTFNIFAKRFISVCILQQVSFLFVNGINAPSFVSSWYTLESQNSGYGHVGINHNLNEYPVKVDVQVMVTDNGEEYIFTGIGSAHRDDDVDAFYGGVIYGYSYWDIRLYVPLSSLSHGATSKGRSAYTGGGQFTGSSRIASTYTQCQVRVRLWKMCDFGDPVFVDQSLTIDDSGNTFQEVTHNLGFYPDAVSVQIYLDDGYVSDAQGNVFVGSTVSNYQAVGGVVYGYDQTKIRLWAPVQNGNDYNGAVFTIIDGWDGTPRWYKNSGTVKIMMWSFPADEIAFTQTLTPFGIGIDTSPYEIDFPESYSIDDYYITVEVQADGGGDSRDYRFQGAGSCMGSGSSDLGSFGGVVYVYDEQRVLLYRPSDVSGGKLVYIGSKWGNGQHPQSSNTGSLIVKVFVASDNVKGACGHGTCSHNVNLISVTCDCSSTSYDGANCKSTTSCAVPEDVDNAIKQYNGTGDGDYVIYSCNFRSYLSSGSQQRICTSGTWSGSLPVCQVFQCSDPGDVVHADKSLGGTAFRDAVSYTCEPGYNLTSGDSNRWCQFNGTWDGSQPICTEMICDDPPGVSGACATSTGHYAGHNVTYECLSGYEHTSGSLVLTCRENGSWDSATPVCTRIECDVPVSGSGSALHYSTRYLGDTAVYTCNPGTSHSSGDLIRTCQSDNQWSGAAAVCTSVPVVNSIATGCQDPGDIANAEKNLQGNVTSSLVVYECNSGFDVSQGDLARTCQSGGTWDGTPPVCSAVKCAVPPPSTGSIQHSEGYYAGDVVTYSCSVGYVKTSGDDILTCLNNGTWDKDTPVCTPVVCPVPANGSNSIVSYTTLSYGSNATYTCSSGYAVVDGDTIRYCWSVGSPTGEWSGSSAECQELSVTSVSITYSTPNATLKVKLQQLRKETEVPRNSTSAYRRSLISVYDSRPSSAYIGTAGIVMLSLIFAFMLLADCSKVYELFGK